MAAPVKTWKRESNQRPVSIRVAHAGGLIAQRRDARVSPTTGDRAQRHPKPSPSLSARSAGDALDCATSPFQAGRAMGLIHAALILSS